MIIEQILVTKLWVFCYLIGDEKSRDGILVDPAGDYRKILEKVKEHRLKIKWIINTHGHFDHASGNAYFLKKTKAKLLIHKADETWLKGRISRLFTRIMGGRTSPEPDGYLEDGNEIVIGDTRLKVIHTPGHSRGSICLYTPGHVFTGDTLFTEGIGRVDLKGGPAIPAINYFELNF